MFDPHSRPYSTAYTASSSTQVPASAVVPPPVRRRYAAVFRLLIALAAATGVGIDLSLADPGRVFSYFTVQSNLLVAVVLALSARRAWSGRMPLPPALTTAALLYVLVTGLVYHVLLSDAAAPFSMTGSDAGRHAVADQLLHTVTPLAVLADWLLLTRPGGLRPRHAALWLLYPAAYLAFVLIRGAALSPGTVARYPYPFLDVEAHGYGAALADAALLGAFFLALGLLLIGLDRLRPALGEPGNRISPPGSGGLK
ncbi:integral membrane regulator [Streptomyces solincola]|uniref:Integral membrane regulator n=1 Tax=Streptomyces solincola TaxID=2100817 RepID=A0A2S9Q025_9ACTN|nr:Pr6Pr family membrane protein [Streptomyces solincola]PRH80035.1 integral membrane regulator [Streptomyces solincola]